MIERAFIRVLVCTCISATALAQAQTKSLHVGEGYEITGAIGGLKEGEKVIMVLSTLDFKDVRTDSAYVRNGVFKLTGTVPEGPRWYNLVFDQHRTKVVQLYINNKERISIKCQEDIEKIKHTYLQHYMTIEGSPSSYGVNCLIPVVLYYRNNCGQYRNYLQQLKDSLGFDPKLVAGLMEGQHMMSKNFFLMIFGNPEPDYQIAFPTVCQSIIKDSKHADFLPEVYDSFNDQLKNSYYGKAIKHYLPLCVGQTFPSFNLPTLDGKSLRIDDVLAKSKMTIVNFWAWNSYEVAKFHEELLASYKKYHSKGLSIVGVSSDTDEKKWKIAASDLPWYQVSDLKGKEGIVEKLYREYSEFPGYINTTNVLIDGNGKIIAWDVSGLELQWYLWKYFGE